MGVLVQSSNPHYGIPGMIGDVMLDRLIIWSVLKSILFFQLCWDRSQGIVSRSADTTIHNRCAWTDDQIDGDLLLL